MTFWNRVTGKVVDAAGLGQKRRAVATGLIAFDGPQSDLRLDIAITSHLWLAGSATGTFFLAAWAAQALQDMAAVLESSAQRALGEDGRLPEATFLLGSLLYDAALWWIEQAQTALIAVGSGRDPEVSLRLPAAAPRFDYVPDALPAHYLAAIEAAGQLGTSAENLLNTMREDRDRLPKLYDGAFTAIESALKVGRAKLDQVEAAEADRQAVRLGRDIWAMLAEVVRLYFLAGQQAAMPALIDPRYDATARAASRSRRLPPPPVQRATGQPATGQPATGQARSAGPARSPLQVRRPAPQPTTPTPPAPPPPPPPTLGQRLGLGFDAWALADPAARATYHNDPGRIAELEAFWRSDTNPAETYRLFQLIADAVRAGRVTARPGEFSRSCPWISTFVALGDVTIGSEHFVNGQLFTLKAGQDHGLFARGFERLGFLPGTRPRQDRTARPAPAGPQAPAASGAPGVDTRYRGERRPKTAQPDPPPEPDIWQLTAAFQRPQRRASPADTGKLRQLWKADPDPAATVAAHAEVLAAVRAGTVRANGDEALRDPPWSQVYLALRPVTIGGVALRQNEKFALEVGLSGGTFRRGISRLGLVRPASG
ncbi:MAG TPA: hypothetical protein VF843_11095 [Streptosporangiaceae bacterium]